MEFFYWRFWLLANIFAHFERKKLTPTILLAQKFRTKKHFCSHIQHFYSHHERNMLHFMLANETFRHNILATKKYYLIFKIPTWLESYNEKKYSLGFN